MVNKREIYWLPDDQYQKALWHLRTQIEDVLRRDYRIHYTREDHQSTSQALAKLSEDFALQCRGLLDHPIQIDYRGRFGEKYNADD